MRNGGTLWGWLRVTATQLRSGGVYAATTEQIPYTVSMKVFSVWENSITPSMNTTSVTITESRL